jgi:hypothetical protein
VEVWLGHKDFILVMCSIHGLQPTLAGPVEELCGTGILCKDDLLQFLFTAYNLQKQFEDEEWKEMWVSKETNMEASFWSQWWHVGEGAKHLLEHRSDLNAMARTIINANKQDTTKNEINSWLGRYMRSVPLKAQLIFLANCHTIFFDKHFLTSI